MATNQARNGQPANYNATPGSRSDGDPSGLEVDQKGNLRTTIGGTGSTDNFAATVFAPGELRVAQEPTQLFYDTFDGGLDTINKWKSPTTGGTGIAATSAAGSGSTTLDSGTTANSFSLLQTIPTFQPTEPGWVYITMRINIENPVLTTGYRFWGLAQAPTSPTIATPINEGAGFDVFTDGKLYAVTYAGGVRLVIKDLSAATGNATQPTDANAHKYHIWYRGDVTYYAIDSLDNVVASFTTGASGPNYNNLPAVFLAVSNSGTHETLVLNGLSVSDTARNNVRIADADFSWRNLTIDPSGAGKVTSGIPLPIQKKSASSTGSVGSLTVTFDSITIEGDTIVVVCGVGNGTQPTITDTNGNTYNLAKNVANGTALNTSIFYASNIFTGPRNVITVTNGGTAASIAVTAYETTGLVPVATGVVDATASATGTSTTPATAAMVPNTPNEIFFSGIGVGTAAQTVTVASGWTNDSGQLNPTTPAGLFSFVSMSQFSGANGTITPSSTITSEPWGVVAASFRPSLVGVEGAMRITDGITNAAVIATVQSLKTDVSSVNGTALAFAQVPVNTEGIKATYSAAVNAHAPAATPTDWFTIQGSATKTIRITKITIACRATAANQYRISLIKYSVFLTGGTPAAVTRVPHDSTNAAVTAVIQTWSGGLPTPGTPVGSVSDDSLPVAVLGTPVFDNETAQQYEFGTRNGQSIVLRGIAQYLALNSNAVALPSGFVADVRVEWTEE